MVLRPELARTSPPRMDHLRAYIGFSYIKYSRTSFIPFYYITEVLNLRPH